MIHVHFTEQQKAQLHYERFHHPHPRVQQKMEALWLKSQDLPHRDICRLVGVSPNTLRSYLRDFLDGGVEALTRFDSGGTVSELDEHINTLSDYFAAHPPHTVAEARAAIIRLTGVKRSVTQVREFLKRLGLAPRKVGCLPAKADVAAQAEFQKK